MNCRASLANVSRLRIQSWIYSLGGWRFERGRARSVDTFSHRLQSSKAAVFILKPNRSPSAPCERITHGIRPGKILWIFQQTFTRNWISQTGAKKETRKKIYRAHVFTSAFCPRLDGSTRWINKFFGNERVEMWRNTKMIKTRLPRQRYMGKANSGNKLGSSRMACDLISVFDFYCYYSYYPNTYSTSNNALSISFFARSSIVPRPSLGTETFYRTIGWVTNLSKHARRSTR